ncbi:MAG: GerMN domain-containing protein [Ilumatobacteraceae bacterium]
MSRPGRAVRIVMVAVLALSGCGLSPDAAPRDLPLDEQNLVPAPTGSGNEAAGPDRIYLAAPGEERLLRSVPRDTVSPSELIETLLEGPNDNEAAQQYSTFIPSTVRLLQPPRRQGSILFLDMSNELTELTGASLSKALAQIVFTAAEIDGVSRVQITIDGRTVSWARPNSGPTTDPLSVYDYPALVENSQPDFPALPAGA